MEKGTTTRYTQLTQEGRRQSKGRSHLKGVELHSMKIRSMIEVVKIENDHVSLMMIELLPEDKSISPNQTEMRLFIY